MLRTKRFALLALIASSTTIAIACSDSDSPGLFPDAGGFDAATFDVTPPDPIDEPDAEPLGDGSAEDAHDAGTCSVPDGDTVSAQIKVTADDFLTLWVNGTLILDKTTTWGSVATENVTLFRSPKRKNVIAVEARNAYNQGGYDRGLLLDLSFPSDAGDAGVPNVVTDLSWKQIATHVDGGVPDAGLPDGDAGVLAWFHPDFVDTAWALPVDQGGHGMSPWGSVFGTSSARWLWSYDSSIAVTKEVNERVYFRKTFYLDGDGFPRATPGDCP